MHEGMVDGRGRLGLQGHGVPAPACFSASRTGPGQRVVDILGGLWSGAHATAPEPGQHGPSGLDLVRAANPHSEAQLVDRETLPLTIELRREHLRELEGARCFISGTVSADAAAATDAEPRRQVLSMLVAPIMGPMYRRVHHRQEHAPHGARARERAGGFTRRRLRWQSALVVAMLLLPFLTVAALQVVDRLLG